MKLKGKPSGSQCRSTSQFNPSPMMLNNSKCFFCNQQVKGIYYYSLHVVSPDIWNFYRSLCSPKHSFLKDMAVRWQQLGPGYSHMLSSLQSKGEMETSQPRSTKGERDMKCLGSAAATRRGDDLHTSSVKLAPITKPRNYNEGK